MQRTLEIRINRQREFQVVQLAQWAAYGDAWLCAHDVFHHQPDDDGSMHCEAMSFGAELWIGYPSAGTDAISPISFGGAMTAVYEHRPDLRRLILRCDPPPVDPLEEHVTERFREVADAGLRGAADNIARYREEMSLRPASAAAMSALTSDRNRGRYVAWMAFGYRRARRRFPSPRKAHRLIESFREFLATAERAQRSRLVVDIDEASLSFGLRGDLNPAPCATRRRLRANTD